MEFFDHAGLIYDRKLMNLAKNEHLIVSNVDRAQEIFQEISPFHLEQYGRMLKKGGTYRQGTTIEELFAIYEADRALKNFLFDYLAVVEVQLRNVLGYLLSERFGTFGYLDADHFKNEEYHQNFLHDVQNERKRANEPFVLEYGQEGERDLPAHVAFEIITMGTLSKVVSNLKRQEQKWIANYFQIRSERVLVSFLRVLTFVRNTCAHHGRLSGRIFPDAAGILKEDRAHLNELDPQYSIHPQMLFAAILALVHLLDSKRGTEVIQHLRDVLTTYPALKREYINFPPHWEAVLDRISRVGMAYPQGE